jgi:SAM-dependent methyltransferase
VTPLDPDAVEADLIAYYDGDEGRADSPLNDDRIAARDAFIAALAPSSRVLELGAGPGRDAVGFLDLGYSYVALDLSFEHCRRCHRRTGAAVVRASVRHLPVRTGSFDAVWTMSTLMHVPDSAIDGVLSEVRRVLAPGGVLCAGVWGGADEERTSDTDAQTGRPPRLFSRRSDERWLSMLERVGAIESFERWSYDGTDFAYQLARVRRLATS